MRHPLLRDDEDVTTLSLITATYNSAGTISDTMRSIAAQTRQPFEHLVMDGGSSDETLGLVRALGTAGMILVSEPDEGFYDACNKAILRARGDVIGFLNSDDFYAHDHVIEDMLSAFSDPAVMAVHADLIYVDQNDPDRAVRVWRSQPPTPASLRRGAIPAHPTVYLRRAVYQKLGGFDLSYRLAADYEFLLRTFKDQSLKAVHIPDIWVRMRTGGATGGGLSDLRRQNREILAARERHGITCLPATFYGHKVANRVLQRLRGRFTRLPQLDWQS